MTPPFDIEKLRISTTSSVQARPSRRPRHRRTEGKFLKGPVPIAWLSMAAQLPGRALHVAIAIRFLAGITGDSGIILSSSVLQLFHVKRHALYRALSALAKAGLVEVNQQRGRAPRVSVLDVGERAGACTSEEE